MNLIKMIRRPWCWLGVLALAACGPRDTVLRVTIRDFDGHLAPVPHLPLVILPYNRDSVLAALATHGIAGRPGTHELDSLFAAVRQPFATLLRETDLDRHLRDSLETLRQQTGAEPRGSARYKQLYLAFATAVDSLNAVEHRLVDANRAAAVVYKQHGARLDQLKLAVTRWEDSTFRRYDSTVTALSGKLGRQRREIVTGADGRVAIRLSEGPWWVYARAPDPADPNAAWYWNLPLRGDSIELGPASAEHRPCYSTRCP